MTPHLRTRSAFIALLALVAAGCSDSTTTDTRPVLESVTPTTIAVGSASQPLTITGRRFTPASKVLVNASPVETRYVNDRELSAQLDGSYFDRQATLRVTVATAAGDSASATQTLVIAFGTPTIAALSTDTASAGRPGVTVQVTGTNFARQTTATFNGVAVPATYVSGTQLSVALGAAQLATPGRFELTLRNPESAASAPRGFTVSLPAPVITLLPATGATAGGGGFTVAIHGTGFLPGSVVDWNGTERAAQYITPTRLTVNATAADVATPGTITLRVRTPGAPAPSNSATITVRALGANVSTVTRLPLFGINDMVWDEGTARLYVSVRATSGALANTLAAVDPATLTVTGSVVVGSQPGRLARSGDGQFIYVGLDGANAVRRVRVANLSPEAQWSVGAGLVAADMVVLPGQPGSVVVSRQVPFTTPGLVGVTVYDDGVPRPQSAPGHPGGVRIEGLESPNVVYGFNSATNGFQFYTIGIDAAGARHTAETTGLFSGFSVEIAGAAGRIYGGDGSVVDAERLVRVGSFGTAPGGVPALDTRTGRMYALRYEGVHVYDMNTFQLLGIIPLPSGVSNDFGGRVLLLRFGADGLALFDKDEIIVIRNPLVAG